MDQAFRFGTVGTPLSTPKKPGGSVGAIIRLNELGLDALELGWVRAVRVSPETCAEIQKTSVEMDVQISIHAPYYINLNADSDEWPKSRQRLMDAAHFGRLAGATDIIFHPGSYFEKPAAEVLPLAIERLAGCISDLRAANNPVFLRPETMGKSAMIGSLEDVLELSRAIEGVKPCIDFAHLHARPGDGSMNSYTEWARVFDAYGTSLGGDALQQMHIHISGIQYGPKGEKEHLKFEDADLDLTGLLQALHDYQCRGRMLCESPVMEEDTLVLKKAWLQIAG